MSAVPGMLYQARYSFYMSEATISQVVALKPEVVHSLNGQVARLGPGEPYMAALADGQVFVRPTRGLPQTLIQLWRRNPAMMIPESGGYQPEVQEVSINDL
jgi:hypothetical protein